MRLALIAFVSAAAMSIAASGTQAAPISGASELKPSTNAVEKAAYRRCWWHRGHRHCRWFHSAYYDDDYYYGGYPYGYSYGPSVGFFFGGGGHRHGGFGHHGHRGHR
jgi:hypothetical protein